MAELLSSHDNRVKRLESIIKKLASKIHLIEEEREDEIEILKTKVRRQEGRIEALEDYVLEKEDNAGGAKGGEGVSGVDRVESTVTVKDDLEGD